MFYLKFIKKNKNNETKLQILNETTYFLQLLIQIFLNPINFNSISYYIANNYNKQIESF